MNNLNSLFSRWLCGNHVQDELINILKIKLSELFVEKINGTFQLRLLNTLIKKTLIMLTENRKDIEVIIIKLKMIRRNIEQ